MDLKTLRAELQKLAALAEGWDASHEIADIERDLALGKLRELYDAVRFGLDSAVQPSVEDELSSVDLPPVEIDLDEGMDKVREILTKYPIKTRLNLKGTLIVARDIAHARIKQMLDEGKPMPEYFKKHPVYYAGPAKTPQGMASGSFGPTTAGRMDPYVDLFQSQGGSLVMVAKGNRSQQVTDACRKHGGFYLGSIGGPAAILAKNSIKSVEVVDFPELGMEAVRKIYVENFPAFIIVDDKGNDFFADFKH